MTEKEAKERLGSELEALERALDDFLTGEVRDGLVSPFKMTLIVQARTLQALVERSKKDVVDNQIRF